jgi:flagellar basal body-associated protein FliL
MGASASVSKQSVTNNLITDSVQKCKTIKTVSTTDIHGLRFSQPPGCPPGSGVQVTQASVVDAECAIGNIQQSAASIASTLSAEAKAGLGFAASATTDDINDAMTQKSNEACKGASDKKTIGISDAVIKACNFVVTQDTSDKSVCELNSAQKQAAQIAASSASSSSGGSFFGDLFGGGSTVQYIIIAIIVIVIIGAIAGIITAVVKSKSSSTSKSNKSSKKATVTGGFMQLFNDPQSLNNKFKENKPYIILIVVILLILVVFMVNKSTIPQKQITDSDLTNFNQTFQQARQIAGLNTTENSLSSSNIGYDASDDTLDNYYKLPLQN